MYKIFILLVLVFSLTSLSFSQSKSYEVQTIAFYNLENLFDIDRDTEIHDESFTPSGSMGWTQQKYENKLVNMSSILPKIGTNEHVQSPPAIIGVCEVENRRVLEDLVNMESLKPYNYKIVHIDSPDERGIDTALLYRENLFELEDAKTFKTILPDENDKTRDILLATGQLGGERVHFLVNHWPSRSGGEKRSMPNRVAAAQNLRAIVRAIQADEPNAKIITMGDFNDDPISPSIAKTLGAIGKKQKLTKTTDLYNPFYDFYKKGYGTTAWRDSWSLFDMLIFTNTLNTSQVGWKYVSANRYTPKKIIQTNGKFKGYPKRTHSFGKYLNGYSDHFPVYIYLARQKESN